MRFPVTILSFGFLSFLWWEFSERSVHVDAWPLMTYNIASDSKLKKAEYLNSSLSFSTGRPFCN